MIAFLSADTRFSMCGQCRPSKRVCWDRALHNKSTIASSTCSGEGAVERVWQRSESRAAPGINAPGAWQAALLPETAAL